MKTRNCTKCKQDKAETEYYECKDGLRTTCKTCFDKTQCIHNKYRTRCFECGGGCFCHHEKRKSRCLLCGGGEICIHSKMRYNCLTCKGTGTCEHGRQKNNCITCNPGTYTIRRCTTGVRRLFKKSGLKKTHSYTEYLGCTPKYFLKYFEKKMTPDMTFENIHIDHIKPVSKFNLDDHDEILKCCHYTNLQPLLAKDNLRKSNKFCDEWQEIWEAEIIYKETTKLYFLPY
jgi:hypothetical protein